jgi:hypothetical protein
MLKKAAVGAGVVWAAPMVLSSTPAFAAGSTCATPRTFAWPNNPPGGDGSSNNFNNWNAGGSGGGATISGSFVGGGGISRYDTSVNTIGGTGTNFQITKDNAALNATAVLTLVFSAPVLRLDFTLLDVDKSTTNGSHYSDEVTVNAVTAANAAVLPTTVELGVPAGGGTAAAAPLDVTGTYPTFRGTASAGDTTTASNVRLVFPATGAGIKTLTITYRSTQAYVCATRDCITGATNPSTLQWIALSTMKWC